MSRPDFDERYAEPGWAYGTEPNDFLREKASRLPTGPVLCLGEGQGRNAVHLAELGHEVVAVDLSGVGLARAQELARSRGVTLTTIQADLATFEMGCGKWSGIISIFCHLPSVIRRTVHRRIPGALAPGGVLLLESYGPSQLGRGTGGPKVADYLPSLGEILEDLGSLTAEVAREVVREVQEGPFHTGPGSVIQVVAGKRESPA
jgi:SAM-dependent methyltransferase